MNTSWTTTQRTLTFPTFWAWLKDHANCILSVSWGPGTLFDDDSLHWALYEQEPRQVVLQLMHAKNPVAELFLETEAIAEVELTVDPDGPSSGRYLAELLSGPADGRQPLGQFLLAHGMDETPGHAALKH